MSTDQDETPGRDVVVVGIDGSEPSNMALRWAVFLARATGSQVQAVSVWRPYVELGWAGALGPGSNAWNGEAIASDILTATAHEVFGETVPPEVTLTVREGGAAAVLLEMSERARMLIVGRRGHGGFAGLLLGSVSGACAEHAQCPVLVIHGDNRPPGS